MYKFEPRLLSQTIVAVLVALIGFGGSVAGEVGEDDSSPSGRDIQENEVARDAENPLSDKISVPVQGNFNFGSCRFIIVSEILSISRPYQTDINSLTKSKTLFSIIGCGGGWSSDLPSSGTGSGGGGDRLRT